MSTIQDNSFGGSPLPLREGKGGSLPPDFISLMRSHLGEEQAEVLFEGLQQPPTVSVRLNPRKTSDLQVNPELLADPVPWCPDAYYLDGHKAFTFDPFFHAGAYYVQDASSMYLSTILERFFTFPSSPLIALDLCAAPGGKSTLLASHLPEGSILVSNEPIRKRAQVLAENMQKWGFPGSIVTQNYPDEFGHFRSTFDLILTDVPCSGEGMFRKDPVAIQEWSLENVHQCAQRQREILRAIVPTLKPGGLLVYSTCTFNRFEDEEQVEWLQQEYGFQLLEECHFLPGRDRGEGLYIAALNLPQPLQGRGEALEWSKDISALRNKISRTMHVMEFTPPLEGQGEVDLSYDDAIRYLRHEALHISAPRGLVVVTYRGLPLGLAKSVGTRLNNLYPAEWRIRTTYNPSDPLPCIFLE